MGVVRFLLLLAVALLVARLVWRWLQPAPPPVLRDETAAQSLSRCRRCGTLTPAELVVWHGEQPYCSTACRDGEGRAG
ncbi:MAG: hypothetical protein H7838_09645 [Magnetococcus sp. DMHC-8]